jgi:dolichyl-phosphate beta-glucosyltransferase
MASELIWIGFARTIVEVSDRSISIVVPVLNGEQFIRKSIATLDGWLAKLRVPCELIVVDDGSTDATWNEVQRAFDDAKACGNGAREIRRHALRTPHNRGKGHAVRRGMLAASGAQRVFLDADLTYPVDNLEPLLAALSAGA